MSFSYYTSPKYSFKPGARVKGGVDAQVIGETLSQIAEEHGGIAPEAVVEAARPESSPLHPCFTWDDSVAANEFRKGEARNLVRVVQVEPTTSVAPVPAFVNVTTVDAGAGRQSFSHYVPSSVVAKDVDLFDSAWRSAYERVESARRGLLDLERLMDAYGGGSERAELVRQALKGVGAAGRAMAKD